MTGDRHPPGLPPGSEAVAGAASPDAWLEQAALAAGTPAYVYFADAIAARIATLEAAFDGRFGLSFAAKSNPNPALLGWLAPRIPWLDVSSIGEMRLGRAAGWEPARMSFTGPAKRGEELREAIGAGLGELVVESVAEAEAADAIAAGMGRVQGVLLRIAPARVPKGFGDQMAGRPSAFGLDVEDMGEEIPRILALRNLKVSGLHIYSGTQCLRAGAVVENWQGFLAIFREIAATFGLAPSKLVFGSGLGIPYHAGDVALDLVEVAAGILPDLDAFRAEPPFRGAGLALELGRYLVGEAGYFVTRVVAVKQSRGSRIVICDGGLNNHLPASGHFGMVIHRNYVMHKVGAAAGAPEEKVDLAGPLCTSIDRLARGILLPELKPGDLVAVHASGAYGLTASPVHFISHPLPREVMIEAGALRDVTRL